MQRSARTNLDVSAGPGARPGANLGANLSARISGVILTLAWAAFTAFAVIVPEDPMALHGWVLLALGLLACAGLLIAWRRPRFGGIIAIAACSAYIAVNWIANAGVSTFLGAFGVVMAAPFILAGLAFAFSSRTEADASHGSRAWSVLLVAVVAALVFATVVLSLGLGIGRVITP